jgi:hypothetical protein
MSSAVLRELLDNNNGMRRGVIGRRKDRSPFPQDFARDFAQLLRQLRLTPVKAAVNEPAKLR